MAEWTDEEREQARELYEKGKVDLETEKAQINVGDHVDTPEGTAWTVQEKMGGFLVNFDKDLPPQRPGHIVNKLSGEDAVFMPLNLMRKLRQLTCDRATSTGRYGPFLRGRPQPL